MARVVKRAGTRARQNRDLTEDGSASQRFVSAVTGREQRAAEKPGNLWGGGNRNQRSRGRGRPRRSGGRP